MIRYLILVVFLAMVSFFVFDSVNTISIEEGVNVISIEESVNASSTEEGKIVGKWCSIVDGADDFWLQFNNDSTSKCGKGDGSIRNGMWFLYDKDSIYFTIEDSMFNAANGEMFVINEVYRSCYELVDENTITIYMQLYKWGHIKIAKYTMHAVRCK